MTGHDIIVVGASAGGVEAVRELARGLPSDLPATLFVVLHFPSSSTSNLSTILARSGPLSARQATDGADIVPGRIYTAPPDYHLLVNRGKINLSHGPTENHHRPAIDPLFRSAANAYGPRVVGVVLTGCLDDGVAGLQAIRRRGGIAVVQDPDDALYPSMPMSAIANVGANYVCPIAKIAPVLAELARPHARHSSAAVATDELAEERLASTSDAGMPRRSAMNCGVPSPDTSWEN